MHTCQNNYEDTHEIRHLKDATQERLKKGMGDKPSRMSMARCRCYGNVITNVRYLIDLMSPFSVFFVIYMGMRWFYFLILSMKKIVISSKNIFFDFSMTKKAENVLYEPSKNTLCVIYYIC